MNRPYLKPDELMETKPRYTIISGSYGPYFHDIESDWPLTLDVVLDKLNEIDSLKDRLAAANKHKRGNKW